VRIPPSGSRRGAAPPKVILAAILACAFVACRREAPPEETAATAERPTGAADREDTARVPPAAETTEEPSAMLIGDSLRVELHAPGAVAAGTDVPIEVSITNISSDPVELQLFGRDVAFDIEVHDNAGTRVWRRLEGRTVPRELQVRVLAPGETLTLRDDWPQRTNDGSPVAEGSYLVDAFVPSPQAEPIRTRSRMIRIAER